MFLAAALLAFSFPQTVSVAATDSPSATTTPAEVAKNDSAKGDSASGTTTLPVAPAPKIAGDNSSAASPAEAIQPATPIEPANPPKFAMRGRMETPRQRVAWIGMSVLGHGTAAFDAYSTRQAVSGGYGNEANPLLRPFAHSGAIYVATQVSPTVMDFLGYKMMRNRRPWVRKMWWMPQAAGAGLSFTAGMHNMSLVK